MKVFVQIVEAGSLTKAANALDTSLPTVVRTLASLEKHLNIRLLNRTTRKITLTVEGQLYLERCKKILFDIEDAELELSAQQSKPRGKLRITAPSLFGSSRIMPLVSKFLKDNEQVEVDLLLLDRNVNLVEEGVDVAIRIGPLEDSSMVAKNVGYLRQVICGTPEFIGSLPAITHPKDLLKIPCIRFTGLSHGSHWYLYEKKKIHNIAVSGPVICNQVVASRKAVCDGLGLGMFLSYQVEEQIKSGELQIVLSNFEPEPRPVSVVYSHAKLMSTRVRVFVDWITFELRKSFADKNMP